MRVILTNLSSGLLIVFLTVVVLNIQDPSFRESVTGFWDRNRPESIGEFLPVLDAKEVLSVEKKMTYVVQKDDTLYRIARNNDTTPEQLRRVNGLKGNIILPGQALTLE